MPKDSSPPAFMFYPDDFASDGKVEAMTTEEVGAYILLLCKSWREEPPGSIPDDDRVLARWARMTPDAWQACRTGVLAAFTLGTDSRWHQRRLRSEYQKLLSYQKQRSAAATIAAKSRWSDPNRMRFASDKHCNGNANAMPEDAISTSSSEITLPTVCARDWKIPTIEECREMAPKIGMPESEGEEFWREYNSQGWRKANGLSVMSWTDLMHRWKSKWERASFGKTNGSKHRDNCTIPTPYQADSVIADLRRELNTLRSDPASFNYIRPDGAPPHKEYTESARKKICEIEQRIKEVKHIKTGIPQ